VISQYVPLRGQFADESKKSAKRGRVGHVGRQAA
jgi:hypothetical protein